MSFLEKVSTSRGDCVYLSHGTDQGRAAWHYVLVDRAKLPIFLKKHENPDDMIDLRNYGKVLYSGWGENPPDDIKQKIQETYGS